MLAAIPLRRLFALLALCLGCSSLALAPAAGAADAFDITALSGDWSGSKVTTQIGLCPPIVEPRTEYTLAMEGRSVITPISWKLTVQSSGDLVFSERPQDPSDDYPWRWTGHITPELQITIRQTRNVLCGGEFNSCEIVCNGTAILSKKKPRIKLQGIEDKCPRQNCRYQITIDIHKSTPSHTEKGK